MHSTSTRFAGLPFLFNLVASLKLDKTIKDVLGNKREYSFVQLVLLVASLRIAGISRLCHVNQVEDIFLRAALGFKKLPDQATLNRLLGRIDPAKGRLLFMRSAQAMAKSGVICGRVLAADSHFIQYYGKSQPLAKKGYCAARRTSVRGFKLHIIYDVASGVILSFRVTPGDVDSRRLMPRLLRDAFEVVDKRKVRYLLIDKGFYDKKLFCRLDAQKLYFVIPACHQVEKRVRRTLSDEFAEKLCAGEVVDTAYQPKDSSLMLRLLIEPAPEDASDEFFAYVTNNWQHQAAGLIRLYRKRWRVENAFSELKHDLYLDKLPSSDLSKITASIMLTLVAYNLSILLKKKTKALIKAKVDTIRRKLIATSATLRVAASLVYVDAVFKEHLPRGRIRFNLSGINSHLKEVIYC